MCMEDYSDFNSRAAVSGSASQSVLEATSRAHWTPTHTHIAVLGVILSFAQLSIFERKKKKNRVRPGEMMRYLASLICLAISNPRALITHLHRSNPP